MRLSEIINIIESVAPLKWQEEWDNSGLQVGNRNADIHAALLTTDVTESVVAEAIELHCDLIISHHPLLFHGLKTICGNTPQERIVALAIEHHIAIYSSHTAMDNYLHGVSGRMAEKLGLQNYRLLAGEEYGLGAIGQLPAPMPFERFLDLVKQTFNTTYIRYIAPAQPLVQTIALCGGAGSEFVGEAIAQKADVYLSADFKYHEFMDAVGQIGIVDIDHWVSEHYTRDIYKELLSDHLTTYISQADNTPVKLF